VRRGKEDRREDDYQSECGQRKLRDVKRRALRAAWIFDFGRWHGEFLRDDLRSAIVAEGGGKEECRAAVTPFPIRQQRCQLDGGFQPPSFWNCRLDGDLGCEVSKLREP
jgi:hypothetical protein